MKILTHGVLLWHIAIIFAAPAPKRQGINIEKTVAQVEQVLRQNSNLPQLSREDILQLLNDIRAEDEKSASASSERSSEKQLYSIERDNEQVEFNEINDEDHSDLSPAASSPPKVSKSSPKSESLMVVLPYTPRDGATLQELYTRPPRVALVRATAPTRGQDGDGQESNSAVPQTVQPLNKTLNAVKPMVAPKVRTTSEPNRAETTTESDATVKPKEVQKISVPVPVEYPDISSDLREFLQQHGLHGNTGSPEDHFLLPLDGFRPLPPVKELGASVDLPEKYILTYDLASPPTDDFYSGSSHPHFDPFDLPPETSFYNPLRAGYPYELETLPSEQKQTVIPLAAPSRKRKAAENESSERFRPIDYDSVKVIPLEGGPDPLAFDPQSEAIDVQKRQSENATTTEASALEPSPTEITTNVSDSIIDSEKDAPANDSSAATAENDSNTSADSTDTGPSIVDLENSFGAPAPADESESMLPPPRKNGFYWMLDWNSFLEVGDGDEKVNIRFEPKLGDPQMFLPVSVP